jgi:hypothetical protein
VSKRPSKTHLYELAKRGAEAQVRELLHEAALLIELFPHLRDSFDKDELPWKFIMARQSGAVRSKKGSASTRRSSRKS